MRLAERPLEVAVPFGGAKLAAPPLVVEPDVLPMFGGPEDERPRVDPDDGRIDLVALGGVTGTE